MHQLNNTMPIELICPAGNLPALKVAVDNGANLHCLTEEINEMKSKGIDILRISPQFSGTNEIVTTYRSLLDGIINSTEANQRLQTHALDTHCNGYRYGQPGIQHLHGTLR